MSAPPSYDSIVRKLNEKVGHNPTPRKVLDAAALLSSSEINILTANMPRGAPPWTATQKTNFTLGLATEMTTAEAGVYLERAADDAATASGSIDDMFSKLIQDLATIDAQNAPPTEGPFSPRLNTFRQTFETTVYGSKLLATKIATYSRRFDQVVIPICNNPNYTTQERLITIREFIADAEVFASDAEEMTKQFTDFKGDFAIFIGSFSGWAIDRQIADTEKLKQARADLEALNKRLSELQTALAALLVVSASILPVTGVLGLFAGIFAPFVIIAGLIAAAVSVGAIVGVTISIQSCKEEIAAKQREIQGLADGIHKITVMREELVRLGDDYLQTFSGNIDVIAHVWQSVSHDAVRIQEWLEGGARDVDMPEYMRISIDNAVSIYAVMADYLDRYASGVM